ncbi:hypothetical protein FVE85_7037 [Porphyridium purpureum]|uniref:AB hydrolase-1 domain-containing protein n=1 Tax=Porphyridium purpureum TaxID=35688 RepID=A0A5J4Z8S1_PORPP|nr:hypothetical protein FVE85_7037 [Porphyridium purpureum]|eukprot:POR9898..scf295_1
MAAAMFVAGSSTALVARGETKRNVWVCARRPVRARADVLRMVHVGMPHEPRGDPSAGTDWMTDQLARWLAATQRYVMRRTTQVRDSPFVPGPHLQRRLRSRFSSAKAPTDNEEPGQRAEEHKKRQPAVSSAVNAAAPVLGLEFAPSDAHWIFLEDEQLSVHCRMVEPAVLAKRPAARRAADGLVFLHGLCGSTFSFRHVQEPLADHCQLPALAFDRPPFGLSTRPRPATNTRNARRSTSGSTQAPAPRSARNPYSLAYGAHMTGALMDTFNMQGGILVAHSLGSVAALDFAFQNAHRVRGLVLIAPSTIFHSTSSVLLRKEIRALLRLPLVGRRILMSNIRSLKECARTWRLILERNFAQPEVVLTENFVRQYVTPAFLDGFEMGVFESIRALEPYNFVERVANDASPRWSTNFPVLVVGGALDQVIPQADLKAFVDSLRSVGSDVDFHMFPDGSHNPHEENPAQFLELVQQWLREKRLID